MKQIIKYIVKKKIELWEEEEYFFVGKNNMLVENVDEALQMETKEMAKAVLKNFIKNSAYREKDFEILDLKILVEEEE